MRACLGGQEGGKKGLLLPPPDAIQVASVSQSLVKELEEEGKRTKAKEEIFPPAGRWRLPGDKAALKLGWSEKGQAVNSKHEALNGGVESSGKMTQDRHAVAHCVPEYVHMGVIESPSTHVWRETNAELSSDGASLECVCTRPWDWRGSTPHHLSPLGHRPRPWWCSGGLSIVTWR